MTECPGLELNQQGVAPTTTSTLRVCQFRHLGFVGADYRSLAGASLELLAVEWLKSKSCQFLVKPYQLLAASAFLIRRDPPYSPFPLYSSRFNPAYR